MKIIKSEYGDKLGSFQFDYLGGHDGIDGILLNGDVSLFEKGILISTSLNKNFAFIEWNRIEALIITKRKFEHIDIVYDRGSIELERVKEEVDLNKFISIVTEISSSIKVDYINEVHTNVIDLNLKRCEINMLEQEKRIEKFIGILEDEMEILNKWEVYLRENLKFPFEAEVMDSHYGCPIVVGDKLKVIGISMIDDLHGIIVDVKKGRKKYAFELCLLEVVGEDKEVKELVDDYSVWFCNR